MTAPAGAALSDGASTRPEAGSIPPAASPRFAVAGGEVELDRRRSPRPARTKPGWLRLDRGAAVAAGEQPVGFGDVISLRLGQRPPRHAGPAGRIRRPKAGSAAPPEASRPVSRRGHCSRSAASAGRSRSPRLEVAGGRKRRRPDRGCAVPRRAPGHAWRVTVALRRPRLVDRLVVGAHSTSPRVVAIRSRPVRRRRAAGGGRLAAADRRPCPAALGWSSLRCSMARRRPG